MKLHVSENATEIIKSKVAVLIDNDILGLLFSNGNLLQETLTLVASKKLILYPLVEFEFLRDVFAPQQRILKEEFIAQPVFGHINTETHMKVFPKLIENSLLLSKIYAHQAQKRQVKNTSSMIDLLLASLLMYIKEPVVIITGNKKDFPSCIFDLVTILNFEQEDGNVRALSVVEFNRANFEKCYAELKKLEAKIK